MGQEEKFITRKPNNSFIEKYISYYYFHNSFNNGAHKKFIYYPSSKNALTIYKNSRAKYGNDYSHVIPDNTINFTFMYSGIQKRIRTAYIEPPFNKIGVVFNELGINHFVNVPLSVACSNSVNMSFSHFGEQLTRYCNSIYSTKNIELKVSLLNEFFESVFTGFHEEKLKHSVELINYSKQKISVHELSEKLDINRRTLLRLFQKHMCCSVKDYIDIVQFRKSLNNYLLSHKKMSLTELALNNNFYDQSQFINHFKKLTNSNPKAFFKNVVHIGEEDTFWTFK